MNIVRVRDFTLVPGARHRTDGDGSAEEFYDDYLKAALDETVKNGGRLTIDLDGTIGYASSFVSELAILIKKGYGDRFVRDNVLIKSDDDPIQKEIFIEDAKTR